MGLINWQKILIDTSVIIRVIHYRKNQKESNKFANFLIESFSSTDAQINDKKKKPRVFYVSAISIAEMLDSSMNTSSKTELIVQTINAENVEIIDFDEDVANVYDVDFVKKLGVNFLDDCICKWGENTNSKPYRECLTKDIMILSCGVYNNADAYITADKGMYRIGREAGLNMVYLNDAYFNYNEKYVFEFDQSKCDSELMNY
jgi:predicted nucleic acid-binding protein